MSTRNFSRTRPEKKMHLRAKSSETNYDSIETYSNGSLVNCFISHSVHCFGIGLFWQEEIEDDNKRMVLRISIASKIVLLGSVSVTDSKQCSIASDTRTTRFVIFTLVYGSTVI